MTARGNIRGASHDQPLVTAVLRLPEIEQRLKDQVVTIAPTSRDGFAAFIRSEIARWARVIKEAGIAQQ